MKPLHKPTKYNIIPRPSMSPQLMSPQSLKSTDDDCEDIPRNEEINKPHRYSPVRTYRHHGGRSRFSYDSSQHSRRTSSETPERAYPSPAKSPRMLPRPKSEYVLPPLWSLNLPGAYPQHADTRIETKDSYFHQQTGDLRRREDLLDYKLSDYRLQQHILDEQRQDCYPPRRQSGKSEKSNDSSEESNTLNKAQERPAYDDEQIMFIWFCHDDLSMNWGEVVHVYKKYWNGYSNREIQGLQGRYYRLQDSNGLPKARKKPKDQRTKAARVQWGLLAKGPEGYYRDWMQPGFLKSLLDSPLDDESEDDKPCQRRKVHVHARL
jgi:hypothetical protein